MTNHFSAQPSASQQPSDDSRPFVRTLLGDLPADSALGPCDAHEHVVMHSDWLAERFPDFMLNDVDQIRVDLNAFRAAGGGWIVDSMPTGAGRDAALLAQVSEQSAVPIVCPTGVHQPRYYAPGHPLLSLNRDALTELFVHEITCGIDDGTGPLQCRAGVIKVASSGDRLTDVERELFAAAAAAERITGCPILTHTQAGPDTFEQIAILRANGAALPNVVLSHCDKNPNVAYHRELLQQGVCIEYDQHFRQMMRGDRLTTVDLLVSLADEFPTQLLLGMDMARQRYRTGYGGRPGMAWLLTDFWPMLQSAGISRDRLQKLFIDNAVNAFAFRPIHEERLSHA